eukprot:2408801-Pyramimonas_sp.AAC.1
MAYALVHEDATPFMGALLCLSTWMTYRGLDVAHTRALRRAGGYSAIRVNSSFSAVVSACCTTAPCATLQDDLGLPRGLEGGCLGGFQFVLLRYLNEHFLRRGFLFKHLPAARQPKRWVGGTTSGGFKVACKLLQLSKRHGCVHVQLSYEASQFSLPFSQQKRANSPHQPRVFLMEVNGLHHRRRGSPLPRKVEGGRRAGTAGVIAVVTAVEDAIAPRVAGERRWARP